jgi:hypothetical protein
MQRASIRGNPKQAKKKLISKGTTCFLELYLEV